MSMPVKALVLGLLISLLGAMTNLAPQIARLETSVGLDWLFRLRGPRPAPPEVTIVSIDRESSQHLELPNTPRKWPRSYHARLVKQLVRKGARVIVFDVIFDEPRDRVQDELFANAIREAGNVILFQYLQRQPLPIKLVDDQSNSSITIEKLVPPIPELAEASAGLAPFPLPKVPARVNQVWTFKTGAGDTPTLPVVAFQHYLLPFYEEFLRLLRDPDLEKPVTQRDVINPGSPIDDTTALTKQLRQLFVTDLTLAPALVARLKNMPEPTRTMLTRLIDVYNGSDHRYLDFYGPPQSITTISYYQILEDHPDVPVDLEDKAVFVGFSEQFQPEQKDGFYTVFSQPDGLDVSGVEIAATAFANLLEGRKVKPLSPIFNLLVIIFWGMAVSALLMLLPGSSTVPAAFAIAIAGLGTIYYYFVRDGTWLPVVVPLLLQLPIALVGALLWRYIHTHSERHKIREAFSYYVPGWVVDELSRSRKEFTAKGQNRYGICLASDAEQYTKFAETLEPEQLHSVLNHYYQNLFEPVTRRGGFISDVVGDAMLAIWSATTPDKALRRNACLAALEIINGLKSLEFTVPAAPFPTRIGLHCGDMLLGNVGAGHHYEFRAVGDMINSGERIEQLNKKLGTRVLASYEVIEDIEDIVTREVGHFRLPGKTRPLRIHELVSSSESLDTKKADLHADFKAGLDRFRAQQWQQASTAFSNILARYGDDGPSRYYLELCEHYATKPPTYPWDGVVNLEKK